MGCLKKYTREIVAAAVITAVYLLTRLLTILKLPIFTDEAIYVRWAQYLTTDIKFWDYALTDGKQPLFIWLTTFLMSFISDPLLAGRLVSVFAGFVTMIGLFYLSRELFKNKWIGFIAAFLYAVYPFALVYDRMALYESLVGTFAIWGLYYVILLIRYTRGDIAIILGIVGGLGALNKSNGFFTILMLPFSLVLIDIKSKTKKKQFLRWIALVILAVVITYGMYSTLRLSPYFHIINQKNAIFVYPVNEWLQHPFTYFRDNLWIGQRDWFVKYFGYPFIIATLVSFVIRKKYLKEKILLVLWFLIPFLILALFGRTIYPRYIFFMTLSLLPLVAYTFYQLFILINNKYVSGLVCFILLVFPFRTDYLIINDFANAPLPISDVSQYNNDWPAGIGIKESIVYLREQEKGNSVKLYTEGTFGLMPYAYEIWLRDDPQFIIEGVWPINAKMPDTLKKSAESMPTYIVFYQPCHLCPEKGRAPVTWPLTVAFEIKKPADSTWLTLYKVNTE